MSERQCQLAFCSGTWETPCVSKNGEALDLPHQGMRKAIIARRREEQRGECAYCRGPLDEPVRFPSGWAVPFGGELDTWSLGSSPHQLSLDHVLPRAQGGLGAAVNLRVVHLVCNYARLDGEEEWQWPSEYAASSVLADQYEYRRPPAWTKARIWPPGWPGMFYLHRLPEWTGAYKFPRAKGGLSGGYCVLDDLVVEAEAGREWPPFHASNPYLTTSVALGGLYDYLVRTGPSGVDSRRSERSRVLSRIAGTLREVSYCERELIFAIKERDEARTERKEHPRRRKRLQDAVKGVRRSRSGLRRATARAAIARAEMPEDIYEVWFPHALPE